MISGPLGLRQITGFDDEALAGKWSGCRSSRLGMQFRVIYRTILLEQTFQVISITPHDYREK